jgi:superfamily II RNA helicase
MVIISDSTYNTDNNTLYNQYFEQFPHILSDFQKHAIHNIVDGNHVLITAHTGSGKTLPAEFAIRHFTAIGKRLIYTSPIKALSNQKYYEFTQKYPDITFGLMTGDIKTNPDAQVVIMTTEILMNALFQGTNTKNPTIKIDENLACVIFDEIHYINDEERGQVWEKTILMLPEPIQMVMLSATIDAPERFAQWCEDRYMGSSSDALTSPKIYKKVALISTAERVVPLTHYGYITVAESVYKSIKDKELAKEIRDSTNKLILIQDAKNRFSEKGYAEMAKVFKIFESHNIYSTRKHILNNLALFLRERDMLPAIAFVFSRKQVEQLAQDIQVPLLEDDSKVAYIVQRECDQIIRKLPNHQEYANLPEYKSLIALLEKGIAIHHSGMIPILREIVEIMISKKYVKLLFATESFAIGLDCPIKTTIFTSLQKFDGKGQRDLYSHEYTQMGGRAGRRGIDTIGNIVHCNNLFPYPCQSTYKTILGVKPQTLVSKFRISYPLVLSFAIKGPFGVQDITDFIRKSMISHELDKSIQSQNTVVQNLQYELTKKESVSNGVSGHWCNTPFEICQKYVELLETKKTSVNKKRKEIEREIARIEEDNKRFLVGDVKLYLEIIELKHEIDVESDQNKYLCGFLENQVNKILNILIDGGFLLNEVSNEVSNESCIYQLTVLGQMASKIAEIHPLIFATIMNKENNFQDLSEIQLIGLLSIFCDVKVQEEFRVFAPMCEDAVLTKKMIQFTKLYEEYNDLELDQDVHTGIHYIDVLNYNIVDLVIKWCSLASEQECRTFLQSEVNPLGISTGDFTKAIMKIATISKEIANIAEETGDMGLLSKLTKIDGHILKFITTSQSLYV